MKNIKMTSTCKSYQMLMLCRKNKNKISFALSIQMKALDVEQLKLFEGSGRQIVK